MFKLIFVVTLKEFVCLLYKSHLEEIKNLQQQDILHILFSKALHCSAVQVIMKLNTPRFILIFNAMSNNNLVYDIMMLSILKIMICLKS